MNVNLKIVSMSFRVTGALMGVLSLLGLADFASTAYVMRSVPPPDQGPPLAINKYGIVALLDDGARVFDHVMHGFMGLMTWVLAGLAILATLVLLTGILFFFIGRGMAHRAMWARVTGAGIAAFFLFAAVLTITSFRGDAQYVAAVPLGFSLYTLWVLVWRFA